MLLVASGIVVALHALAGVGRLVGGLLLALVFMFPSYLCFLLVILLLIIPLILISDSDCCSIFFLPYTTILLRTTNTASIPKLLLYSLGVIARSARRVYRHKGTVPCFPWLVWLVGTVLASGGRASRMCC